MPRLCTMLARHLLVLIAILRTVFAVNVTQDLYCSTNQIGDPNAVAIAPCASGSIIQSDKSIQVSCSPGYYLNSSSTITCRLGKWDDVQCIPGCPPPGKRSNSQLATSKTGYDIEEKAIYICDDGNYSWSDHRKTHFILTCQNDSTWSDKGAAGCGVKNEFSVTTVKIRSLNTSVIELECEFDGDETIWFRNGEIVGYKELGNESSQFKIATSGNLNARIMDAGVEGFYTCGAMKTGLRMGRTAYELVTTTECQREMKSDLQIQQGESLLLQCPQEHKDYSVKWFKDDEEIFSNKYRNVIQSTGLYFQNINHDDGGLYKCLTTYTHKESRAICQQNKSYNVMVTASAEEMCGVSYSHKQPWLATLYHHDENIPFCYGTLLNSKWIITSAFCLLPLQRKKIIEGVTVQVGLVVVDTEQIFKVASVKLHPRYRQRLTPFDIGLVELHGSPIQFTSNLLPACISPDDIGNIHECENLGGMNGIVARRGSLVDWVDHKFFAVEQMSLDPKEDCRETKTIGFAEDKFCAKFNGSEENFAGDNGSPFMVNYNGRRYLLGVYTWGERETGSGKYDYFTSISRHFDWIKRVISYV